MVETTIDEIENTLIVLKFKLKNLAFKASVSGEEYKKAENSRPISAEYLALRFLARRIKLLILLLDQYFIYRDYCFEQKKSWNKIINICKKSKLFEK